MVIQDERNLDIQYFDINTYLSSRSGIVNLHNKRSIQRQESITFKEVVNMVNDFFKKKFEDQNSSNGDEQSERQRVQHAAMMGDEEAMNMLMDEIATYLRENKIHSIKYPAMYKSLAHGVFEQIFRFKEFYSWNLYPESVSAFIRGKEIWFKINGKPVKQEYEFDSDETVNEIIRAFQLGNRNFKINEKNPQGELELADGTRVTLTIPPRTPVPTIAFRRFTVDEFSFDKQVRMNTVDDSDKRLLEIISQTQFNTVIAGGVESGKSTLLKTIYAYRPANKIAISIEEHPELFLARDFPDRLQFEFSVKDGDIKRVFRTILRYDHDYIIFQEVRGVEADYAIDGASRGATGLLMTYHVTHGENIVEQLAQHIIDEFPNRRYSNEVRRISQTLDLGKTMGSVDINGKSTKKFKSLFEICYDHETDKAWIQYIMKYDEDSNSWKYSSDVTDSFYQRLKVANKYRPEVVEEFKTILASRAKVSPLHPGEIKVPIHFKEEA